MSEGKTRELNDELARRFLLELLKPSKRPIRIGILIDNDGRAGQQGAGFKDDEGNEWMAYANAPASRAVALKGTFSEALAWFDAHRDVVHGVDPKRALSVALRQGAQLPNDRELRRWVLDILAGSWPSKARKARGRPRKDECTNLERALESSKALSIAQAYDGWLERFRRNKRSAWWRVELLRHIQAHTHVRYEDGKIVESYNPMEIPREMPMRTAIPRKGGVAAVDDLSPHELALFVTAEETKTTEDAVRRALPSRRKKSK